MVNSKPTNLSESVLLGALLLMIFQKLAILTSILQSELLQSTNILEATFFIIAILNYKPENQKKFITGAILAFWGVVILLLSSLNGAPLYESFRSIKWILYLCVLHFIGSTKKIRFNFISSITKFLLVNFSLVYNYEYFVLKISRPTLFTENNYEIAFLAGLIALSFLLAKGTSSKISGKWLLLFTYLVVLSGSRSGLITCIYVLLIVLDLRSKKISTIISISLFLPLIYLATLRLMEIRGSNLNSLDRYQFLRVFVEEMANKNVLHWIFGNLGINPISTSGCYSLRYYSGLFSDLINETCYSVVFHSFLIRVTYDFGIFGLLICFVLLFQRLKNQNRTIALTLLGIAIINSTSVSGPNNVYVMLSPLLLIITTIPLDQKMRA